MKTWHAEATLEAMRTMLHGENLFDRLRHVGRTGDAEVFSALLDGTRVTLYVTADLDYTVARRPAGQRRLPFAGGVR